MNFEKIGKYLDEKIFPISHKLSSTFLTISGLWLVFWYPIASNSYTEGKYEWYWWLKQPTVYIIIFIAIAAMITSFVGSGKLTNLDNELKRVSNLNEDLRDELNQALENNQEIIQKIEDAEVTIYHNRKEHQKFVYDSISKYLMHISSDHLDYSDKERLSIYRHVENQFYIAGRYSQNINHNKQNRIRFPDDEGCIGEAWSTGNAVVKTFKGRNYANWQSQECGISVEVLDAVRMKSISYCAIPINENTNRVGVLLFESIQSDKLNLDAIQESLQEHYGFLIEMLKESIKTADIFTEVDGVEV